MQEGEDDPEGSRIRGFERSSETIKNKNIALEPLNPRTFGPLFIVGLSKNSRDLT
jgi:hypothetical protein